MGRAFDPWGDSSDLSSPPTSPSPPPGFLPTPPPSQGNFEPKSADPPALTQHCAPPTKERRKVEPKPRITKHLDLSLLTQDCSASQTTELGLLLKALQKKRKIVVIAGAGISVSAGIPDFRSSHGLFKTLKKDHKLKASGKQLFDASVYRDNSMTSSFHDMVRSLSRMAASAKPTAFHHLLARLAKDGRLMRLYTQNVDGIETSLPPLATEVPLSVKAPWPRTIQLHGGLEKMVCQKCRHTSDFEAELFQGPDPPLCRKCCETDEFRTTTGQRSHGVGKLRPRIVLYNEHNPDEDAIGSVVTADLRARPDALIVVGTTLKIPGVRRIVKEMCQVVRGRKDGITMWINHEPVPVGRDFESCWDLVIKGDCDEVARQANLKPWDDDSDDIVQECTASDVERVKQEQGPFFVVVHTPKKAQKNTGILTPSSSQDEAFDPKDKPPIPINLVAKPAKKSMTQWLSGKDNINPGCKRKNPPTSKAGPPKNARTTNPAQTKKIDQQFRIGKSTKATITIKKSISPIESEHSKPMLAISPGAARNNGPMFPEISASPPWKDKATISPSGTLPPDLERMLN
ncbi:Sir2 family histone deacetylase Hst4 [Paracoccidioides lutzii Pb01]|uniref:Sir2 family histone deacetylase Hst4 n=1 Tax=Paracoccidioides lutzii (strain ATCC MYA-826 / Pb01) TaxID=502779 RepID=C1GWJ6_PARBA|nr:Sir2 family histone deacetylase Hst4 [Paracoccidioides lutzii Pb01]EEH40915.1 Sir2 family histone deacetylase Hst4 [Paracoccidioides lutzii Pb01]